MIINGCSALVTGGASGLGLATATALHAAGAHVVLLDLPGAPGEAIADRLNAGAGAAAHVPAGSSASTTVVPRDPAAPINPGTSHPRAQFVPGDVTSAGDVQAAVDAAVLLGPLRIVVNCAGIAPGARTVGRDGPMPLADFDRAIRINLVGTFNVTRLAAAAMMKTAPVGDPARQGAAERGVIVNTASVAAFDGQIGQAAYAASKGGVAAMTLPLAREFAPSFIRVMTIAPGTFDTPMLQGLPTAVRDSLGAQVPHPSRLGDPAEYASLVRHIVDNPMLNGETIRLDGAIRMQPK
ncbi:SDR family NAD(P)-dependent oxidoreductase [Cryobacterium melibiosiphilum]|uniref:SDR family NAD(P)-dependent oxidoreductase n=1 Tax=Cryobacterium melibiosiphilum TaxID=995039 RepID=A0A3A5MMD2_9MICO|nr:SDR family NAD(P)-dependent oxidoreductase [Cryobacterium melibiosiphilum]RJT88043.1 SDR family NAD(P)-dependent oxidoreductase [Cryobacterium melibiosiphilum]